MLTLELRERREELRDRINAAMLFARENGLTSEIFATEALSVIGHFKPFNETVYVKADGSEIDPTHCLTPDNYVQTFTVKTRALSFVHWQTIKSAVERKLEVLSVREEYPRTCVVK
jgi:hypothetical protein